MKVQTATLSGRALDWMAGIAAGMEMSQYGVAALRAQVPGLGVHVPWQPTFYWNQFGPLLDSLMRLGLRVGGMKCRYVTDAAHVVVDIDGHFRNSGPNLQVAGLRCFVESCLGAEVEVPDTILKITEGALS